nr:hypothetical protein [Streptomyces adustus]
MLIGLAATCVITPHPTYADVDLGRGNEGASTRQEGSTNGHTLQSRITFSGSTRGNTEASPKTVTPVDNWIPPACWYEPMTAEEFAASMEKAYDSVVNDPRQPGYAKAGQGQYREIYKDGKYKNYNLDEKNRGSWWVAAQDHSRLNESGAWACDELPFWVERGGTPLMKNTATPRILAELAYNRIQLPDTVVSLAPAHATKVNLPTWVWLDTAKFKEVSVTATLNAGGINIQAITTARPISLKLEPGTLDAKTFPPSGECVEDADGSIGERYSRGNANDTPPCGIEYFRSSIDGNFRLRAVLTWKITWKGTGDAGGNLPNGTFGKDQDIAVEEIQAINR